MATRHFLIKCACGNLFWRKYPANPNLQSYRCPRDKGDAGCRCYRHSAHQTQCTTALEQFEFVRRLLGRIS